MPKLFYRRSLKISEQIDMLGQLLSSNGIDVKVNKYNILSKVSTPVRDFSLTTFLSMHWFHYYSFLWSSLSPTLPCLHFSSSYSIYECIFYLPTCTSSNWNTYSHTLNWETHVLLYDIKVLKIRSITSFPECITPLHTDMKSNLWQLIDCISLCCHCSIQTFLY